MKINFSQKIFLTLFIFSLTNSINCSEPETTKTSTEKKEHKKLNCGEMDLLNKMFEQKPIYAVRMNSAYEIAEKTIQFLDDELQRIKAEIEKSAKTKNEKEEEIEQKQNELVKKSKEKLLRPVKNFFEPLYTFKNLLQPLIVDIFNQDEKYKKILVEGGKVPYFLQFFELKKEETVTFFDNIMKDRDTIIEICEEFFTAFGPVTASMTDKARAETEKLTKELKEKSQKAKQVKK